MFTFLPQYTVHDMRISELGVPVYSSLIGIIPTVPLRNKKKAPVYPWTFVGVRSCIKNDFAG